MTVEIVDPGSDRLAHVASVDVKLSGAHIGGGVYFSANHNPRPGGTATATPQASLDGEGETHATTEIDFTLPQSEEPWNAFRDDLNFDGNPDAVKAGFDISLHVGARLSNGAFYDGPAAPLLIAADADDLTGNVLITGFPNARNSLTGEAGVMHQSGGVLAPGDHTEQVVDGHEGGFFTIIGPEARAGMSGGAAFLEFDPDGDGVATDFIIGAVSRGGRVLIDGLTLAHFVQAASFSAHYDALADAVEGLTGDAARSADDFARMTLLSGQSVGSDKTTVEGRFFHEDIYGGVNDDDLSGGGGDDLIRGGAGRDRIDGGAGDDTIMGGEGRDRMDGGAGDDLVSFADAGQGGVIILHGTKGAAKFGREKEKFTNFEAAEGSAFDDHMIGGRSDDVLIGGGGDDRLRGGRGDDSLTGGAGDDELIGWKGADVLTGDDGADAFVFNDAEARDVVTDFDAGEGDVLDLRRIDADVTEKRGQAFDFIGEDAFSGEAGELRFETSAEGLTLLGDRDGDGAADFELLLEVVATIDEGAILL